MGKFIKMFNRLFIGSKTRYELMSLMAHVDNSPKKKSYEEFKYGLIDHDHEYDYSKLTGSKESGHYYPCKHYGCNIVSVQDENGKWLDV